MQSRIAHYGVIAAVVLVAYLPIFSGDFIYDDQALVRDNPYIRQLQTLSSYLSQEDGIVDERDRGRLHTGYYRPLVNVTYFLDYRIWGMKAYGFRATNLLLHLVACFLLYEWLLRLTGRGRESFWAVLLFALHPVQTETISIIVARNNILAAVFILATLHGYIAWWDRRSPTAFAVSLVAFAGAVFSKEFGLMAVPILFLYQRLLADRKDWKRELEGYIPYLAIVAVYLILRKTVVFAPLALPEDLWTRIAFVPYLIAWNLKVIFLPHNLHSFSVAYPASLASPGALGSFLLAAGLAGLLWVLRREPLVIFSAAAFVAALLPVLNLVAKASVSLVAMRWLYLPMMFLAVSVAWLLGKAGNRGRLQRAVLVVVAAYFAFGSYTLNAYLWHDHETFLKQEVQHFRNDLYMGDYAEILFNEKRYAEAEHYFRRALSSHPRQAYNYINYSALLNDTGRPREAIAILEKARALVMGDSDRSNWNNNMGGAWALVGDYGQAIGYFERALVLNPRHSSAHRNLAAVYSVTGRVEEAARHRAMAEDLAR